jgi:Ca-activated chloride channel family protein
MNESIFPSIHPSGPPPHPGVYAALAELVRLKFRTRGFSFLPRQPVRSILAGRHASRLRGRGLNFEEIRRYLPGDDIRNMDWRVTARTRQPHVRVYTEEHDRSVLLVVVRPALIQRIFLWVAWLCVVLALARPQWLERPIIKALPTRDLLLAVDLSGSMDTQDFTDAAGQRVDRLTAVKEVLDDFLARRKGDRVGLSFFGSAAFVQAPFTEDLDACRTLLDEAQVRIAGPKTAFGDAIGLALTIFEHDKDIRDRVLIALTDGNDTGSQVSPIRAAEIARDRHITIHTVAVGDPTAAGEEKLDEETLKAVAATTGGRYSHANDRAALADIYAQLDALRTRNVQTVSHRPRRELFHWPLGVGLLLSLAYHLGWAVRTGLRRKPALPATAAAPVGMAAVFSVSTALSQFHFLRPWWLLALVPALWLVWMIHRHQDGARLWRGVIADHLLPHLLLGAGPHRRLQPVHLLLAIWVLTTLALVGPTWQREPVPFAEDEAALVIAVEVTPTMLAQDIQPSRLERAAQKIRDLLAERPGTHTALVAYAGSAHLVMPLTRDADLIGRFAAELSPVIMPIEGEAAAEALTLAEQQLRKSGLPGSTLFITDGVPAEQLPQLTAYRKNGGAPVQLLAVAADPGASIPPDSPPAPALDRAALDKAADALNASLTIVSPDDRDVRWLARHTETSVVTASADQPGERWKDAGYWLVFGVAALALMWFRPGWLVQWS